MDTGISPKDILEWSFVIAALDLGVLGFVYNSYVTVRLLDEPAPLMIVQLLKFFCRGIAVVLVALTVVSVVTGIQYGVAWQVWVIITCLVATTIFAAILAYWMD
ncbi:hypothetical protein PQQ51_06105 [Paraburkholderia xenovorans]|uniref:hypothetical protein n=1 Tax=Paraburkholderia xenovorans TaxID=36873 RepID=UPI0038B9F495